MKFLLLCGIFCNSLQIYDTILQAILSEYEIDEATARNDLDDLLAKFRAFEVLE